jgi:hypothetical protein
MDPRYFQRERKCWEDPMMRKIEFRAQWEIEVGK